MTVFAHSQTTETNLWMKLPTIPPGLAGKIVKYRPLSEPIRLQDLEDSARSQACITHIDEPCWLDATLYLTKKQWTKFLSNNKKAC